jgi:hypothetical protein
MGEVLYSEICCVLQILIAVRCLPYLRAFEQRRRHGGRRRRESVLFLGTRFSNLNTDASLKKSARRSALQHPLEHSPAAHAATLKPTTPSVQSPSNVVDDSVKLEEYNDLREYRGLYETTVNHLQEARPIELKGAVASPNTCSKPRAPHGETQKDGRAAALDRRHGPPPPRNVWEV